jgi:hypothetical protein
MWERFVLRRLHNQEIAQRIPAFLHLLDKKPPGGDRLLDLLVPLVERLDHMPTGRKPLGTQGKEKEG